MQKYLGKSYSLYEREKELKTLASIDQDEDGWGIDRYDISFDPTTKKYSYITASGCSCWDGDYDESLFDSFNELIKVLDENAELEGHYMPSVLGAQQLIAEAKDKKKELKLKNKYV